MPVNKEISWLIGLRLQSVIHRDGDWIVAFDGGASITVECLWRLTEGGRIRFTSQDDGHQFGLPAPVNAAEEVTRRLAGALVKSVELRDGTLDLEICFGDLYTLQIIPDSSGYESWHLCGHKTLIIAVGGGDLAIFREDSSD